ncbi:glycosyltransferase family 4 protein [Natrinema salsiterrestre]|uniref:Glycosyltransferase family 4 protein n=1 Tax=Natrinema salsiterrestre TaxID=2950540 RepID=A0A9Q4L5S9_9EURY|nr:glycosyltransferase family 4 protein [Natrinema salsiterrestre]MDF9747057.1 glycosyltransferase family 4 protein [Natrinema salsiterrestre]
MKISHYFEFEDHVTGGIRESVVHQRKMLDRLNLAYTVEPSLEADVLHCNLMGPRSVWYAKRARSRGIPVVANTHVTAEDFGDSFRFTNALAKPLKPYLRWAYGLADALVCPSAYNRGLIETYTDTPTRVVSNGVDREKLEGFESLEAAYRERYDLDPPTVFLVGHVIKRKGLETFVELARRLPELDFAWFGPLDLSLKGRETTALIEESPENCTFTGYVDDIRGAYAAGDIFCFPTHEENEGIALLEAMTAGKPVLVRDIETFSWLADGEDSLKVAGSGVSGFEDALERLTDPELRSRLGTNARRRSEEFSLETVADRYQSLYEEVV